MATPLYPAKVAERERVRNQKILQDKLEKLEGQRRSAQDQLLAKIDKREMEMESIRDRVKRYQLDETIVDPYPSMRDTLKEIEMEEARQALRQIQSYRTGPPWNDGLLVKPQQAELSYPFALRLTGVMQRYLDGQRLSASSAEVIRAEILEPSSSGMVKVCVVFKRNGSAYVDQFSITLEDIRSRGGLTAVSELTLKTLERAYNQAMLEFDQSGAQLAMRQLLDKPKEEKPITALDVILTPGHRMIEI